MGLLALLVFVFPMALGSGCKTSSPASLESRLPAPPPPCEVEHNGQCVLRGASEEDYEAKAEVMAAEAEREASLFSQRLARWRKEEEARQRLRARTSSLTTSQSLDAQPQAVGSDPSAASAGQAPQNGEAAQNGQAESVGEREDPGSEDDLRLGMGMSFDEGDSKVPLYGTSIRALASSSKKPVSETEDANAVPASPPASQAGSDEAVLRMKSAKCLLLHDRALVEEAVRAAQRSSRVDRKKLGELALASVEIQVLIEAIDTELGQRKVVQGMVAEVCRQDDVKGLEKVFRQLVGPPASTPRDASRYSRGLARLRGALERESGLPRSK